MGQDPAGSAVAWREPGAILLVSCYDLGRQTLGLASPLAFLERAGFRPEAADVAVEPFDPERARDARLVGISVPMHTALRLGLQLARRVRAARPDVHLCFYGLYALLNGEHLLREVADSVIGGEFEGPLVELALALEAGRADPVPGVWRKGEPPAAARPWLAKLDFPVPSRGALPPLERYARLAADGETRLVGTVEASRGCLHGCRHCPIPPVYGRRFFVVPREVVLADVRRQVAAGARHVTFADPDFLNGPTHSLAIARALHAEHPDVTFDVTTKIEHLLRYPDRVIELGRLGCLFLVSAVESFSDTVLAKLDKGHTREDVFSALALIRRAGIALRPSFVAFTPWTTLEDHTDLFAIVEREELVDHVDPVQLTVRLLVPPGSWLLESDAMRPHLGAADPERFKVAWTHPDPRMDRLAADSAALAERSARAGEDPRETFQALRRLARRAAGRKGRGLRSRRQANPVSEKRPPRLTESWFC